MINDSKIWKRREYVSLKKSEKWRTPKFFFVFFLYLKVKLIVACVIFGGVVCVCMCALTHILYSYIYVHVCLRGYLEQMSFNIAISWQKVSCNSKVHVFGHLLWLSMRPNKGFCILVLQPCYLTFLSSNLGGTASYAVQIYHWHWSHYPSNTKDWVVLLACSHLPPPFPI